MNPRRASSDIPYLLAKTLIELAVLPIHVTWFLLRHKRIQRDVREVLEASAKRYRNRPDVNGP